MHMIAGAIMELAAAGFAIAGMLAPSGGGWIPGFASLVLFVFGFVLVFTGGGKVSAEEEGTEEARTTT